MWYSPFRIGCERIGPITDRGVSSGVCNPSVPMRPLLVGIGHELAEGQRQVLLVQNNDVVETLSPQGANDLLHNCVRGCRVDRGGDGVDANAFGPLTKVTAIDSVPIAKQMPWLVAPGCRLDERIVRS
jgi:hypothetical protein